MAIMDIARPRAYALDTGMGDDDRLRGEQERIVNGAFRGVRQVQ